MKITGELELEAQLIEQLMTGEGQWTYRQEIKT